MDENGIKMKAHFRIMKICGRRLGSRGRLAEVPSKLILKFMYVWLGPRQSPCVIFTMGAKVENITKILIVFEGSGWSESFHFIGSSCRHPGAGEGSGETVTAQTSGISYVVLKHEIY